MLPHCIFSLPENGIIAPERASASSQRLSSVSAKKLVPSFFSFGGIYAIIVPSLWCTVGRIIILWEESWCFSGQPVVKATAIYKTQPGGERGNAGATSSYGSVLSPSTLADYSCPWSWWYQDPYCSMAYYQSLPWFSSSLEYWHAWLCGIAGYSLASWQRTANGIITEVSTHWLE